MHINKIGEIKLLENIRTFSNVQNIGDDCAVLSLSEDKYLLVSTDMLVEGVHFSPGNNSWREIGRKAVEVNLSDIAAMGGMPTQLFISLALPGTFEESSLRELYQGLTEPQVPISGGDLVSSDKVTINICVLGEVEKDLVLRRSGASIGDMAAVTGTLGGSAASNYTSVPVSQVEAGRKLAQSGVITSMTDISDGLARSIYDLSTESKVGIKLHENSVPLAPGATMEQALHGGEDYELLFTFKPGSVLPVQATVIGEVVAEGRGSVLQNKGYEHFSV
ncbi:thiamine-phosphate kinase [Candidatus Margulisiibacteriota bacterium]